MGLSVSAFVAAMSIFGSLKVLGVSSALDPLEAGFLLVGVMGGITPLSDKVAGTSYADSESDSDSDDDSLSAFPADFFPPDVAAADVMVAVFFPPDVAVADVMVAVFFPADVAAAELMVAVFLVLTVKAVAYRSRPMSCKLDA